MKTIKSAFRLACLIIFGGVAHAQFYAPDTEFHDLAQRTFVVELARVLAWRHNLSTVQIQQVKYQVTRPGAHETEWRMEWLDPQGKALLAKTIHYPDTLLDQGPAFYRSVYHQFDDPIWEPAPALEERELMKDFWLGATEIGMSRMESLGKAITAQAGASPTNAHFQAHLAGLLTHCALPSLGGSVTLDAMLLGRSAAWLVLAEAGMKEPSANLAALYAPVIFLAGREKDAQAAWKAGGPVMQKAGSFGTPVAWWNFLLQHPSVKNAFVFAARPENRDWAMPLLAYYAGFTPVGETVPEVLQPIFGPDPRVFTRLHDYGPLLAFSGGVGGGRLMEGAWPVWSRLAWVELLEKYPPSALDYTGYVAPLKTGIEGVKKLKGNRPPEEEDTSVLGLHELGPVIKLGHDQGRGDLIPVGIVTARDLLNYGWEMNGLQMGARYRFVARSWGVPELAKTILATTVKEAPDLTAFLPESSQASVRNLKETLHRWQYLDGAGNLSFTKRTPFADSATTRADAVTFLHRCWLRPGQAWFQVWNLHEARTGNDPDLEEWVQAIEEHGSLLQSHIVLDYLSRGITGDQLNQLPRWQEVAVHLAESMPEPDRAVVQVTYDKRYATLNNFERAKALERVFWTNRTAGVEARVIRNYLLAGANNSARRFYRQLGGQFRGDVGFSNGAGRDVFLLAYFLKDRPLMNQVVEECATGSASNMYMEMWNSVAKGDFKELQQQADDLIERYEPEGAADSMGRQLKRFLPLIPALKDPAHKDHAKALDYFAGNTSWTVFQWILLQQCKLSLPDAIRFLGGAQTDPIRKAFIAYLQKDTGNMHRAAEAASKFTGVSNSPSILAWLLNNELLKVPLGSKEEDLMPPGSKTILEAVLEQTAGRPAKK